MSVSLLAPMERYSRAVLLETSTEVSWLLERSRCVRVLLLGSVMEVSLLV